MKKIFYLVSISSFLPFYISAQNYWQQTNGPYAAGYITAIEAFSNEQVFVAISDVGLYHSTDSGNSFSYVSGELSETQINLILINQFGHIFVGIWDYPYRGLSRSTDNGNTWIQELPDEYVLVMAMDSDGYIYAGTNESGMFRSSDNGDTWTQINIVTTIKKVKCISTNSDGELFASGWTNSWPGTRALRSIDNGVNWDSLSIPEDIYITNFAFSENGNIVASFQPHNPTDSSGFLLSSNNGNSWLRKNYIRSYYGIYSILFDEPTSSFYAVVYNVSVWDIIRSTDNGNSWLYVTSFDYDQPDRFCFESDQQNQLFVGDVNGFRYSSDSGYNWVQSDSGFYATGSKSLTLLPNKRLYVGTNSGIFKLAEDKINWIKDSGLVGSFLISNTEDYFLSNGKIRKSTDNGNSWFTVFVPALSFSATSELTKTSNGYIFSGGWEYGGVHGTGVSMVWRSTNNGETWEAVYGNGGDKLIYTITSTNNDLILAGGNDGEIVRSTDFGGTWNSSNVGIPTDAYCKMIRVSQNGLIFVGTSNYGVYRSTDSGLSWNSVNNGISSLDVRSISINKQGKIFAGTSNGVFVTIDDGDYWSPRNSGLLDVPILSLLCDSLDYLYAATMSTGVYRSTLPTTSMEEDGMAFFSTYKLNQNYPNPFNPTTTITYQIPQAGFVRLKVYDILGREVATLVDEEKPAGGYEVQFNSHSGEGRNLTSGMYFYQLKAGDYSETKKMILLK
jgi:photosystem II stability/assembly factor-like uncharacterized protein